MRYVKSSDALMQETGQGDAYVFRDRDFSGLRGMIAQNKELEQKREHELSKRNNELANQLNYNQKGIFYPYQKEQENNAKSLLELRGKIYNKGKYDINDPDVQAFEGLKNQMEQNAAKAKQIQDILPDVTNRIQKDPFIDYNKTMPKVWDRLHDETGTSRKSIIEVNPTELYSPLQDPENFNSGYAVKHFADSLPEIANTFIQRQKEAEGDRFNETDVKSKFYQHDQNGRVLRDPSGQPIITISPETREAFYASHPLARPWVQNELAKPENKGLTEDQFLQKRLSPYAYERRNKNIGSLERPRSGSDDDKVNISVTHDVSRNTMSKLLQGGKGVKEGYLPTVITLSGSKMDKPVRYNLKEYVDEETGNLIKEQIGDKEIHFTEIQKRPYNKKTGKFLQGNKEDLDANPDVGYKWVASGRLKKSDDQDPTPIFVELSDVKDKINKAYNIDLDKYTESKDSLELKKQNDPLGIR
jgi:hypothetical protein